LKESAISIFKVVNKEQASKRIFCIAQRKSSLGPSCSELTEKEALWGGWSHTGPAESNNS